MSQKLYLNILKVGVWLSLLSVFFVFKNLLFPFITSKQISFNILIEVLFILWVGFIVKYPEYRPKKHYTWFGLIAFFGALVLSSIFGVDWNLSFWGDVERMLGVFHLLHFLAFYFIIITVMRKWVDWQIFFIISIGFAIIISIHSISVISYATIGNTAYVSGYLIFNMYFALLMFFREKNPAVRWLYIIALLMMVPGFNIANTTGAWVGLLFSVLVVVFLYGILSKNKTVRVVTISLFILGTIGGYTMFIGNRDNILTQNNQFLRNLVAEVNLNKRTFQTRLVSWKAAIQGIKDEPVLGTGHGNYAVVFDKYFDPVFYNYSRGETYFDRAHNNILDIATTSGLTGLATYFSFLLILTYYLIQGYRKGKIGLHEFVVLSALMTAYFVQNLAVFDSLVTYMALMMTLGYVYWIYEIRDDEDFVAPHDEAFINREIYALFFAGIIALTILYQYNVKPLKMLMATIDGQRSISQGNVEQMYTDYQRALGYNTVLDRDSRTSMVRSLISNPAALNKLTNEKATEILDFNIRQAKANTEYNASDSLNQMLVGQILNTASTYFRTSDPNQAAFYADEAMKAVDASIAASPRRTPIYYQKAQFLINLGKKEEAIATLEYAATLNTGDVEPYCHLGRTLLYFQEVEKGYVNISKCIDLGGATSLQPANLIKQIINHYAEATGTPDFARILPLYEALANNVEKGNPENWVKLSILYQQMGDIEKAREAAEKVIEIEPSMKAYADEFLKGLGE